MATTDDASPPTRRERLREELVRDLTDAAREQLRDVGAEALSLRAIARDVGMSPAGVYRYFDGRDELLTALITEGFDDLADHLFAALGMEEEVLGGHGRSTPEVVPWDRTDPAEGVRRASRALRRWSLDHPNEFGLLFGDPVRGYAAPVDGSTTRANERLSRALLTPLVVAHLAGELEVDPVWDDLDDDPAGRRLADDISRIVGAPIAGGAALRMVASWARLHGFVALEVFGQFRWLFPDGADAMFEAEVTTHLHDLGLGSRS